jgi:hypothetical protein
MVTKKATEFHQTSLQNTIKITGTSTTITNSVYTTESDDLVEEGTTSGEATFYITFHSPWGSCVA